METYWLKIAYFSLPLSSLTMFPLEYSGEVNHEETIAKTAWS